VVDRPTDDTDWLGESAPDNEDTTVVDTPTGDDTPSPSPEQQPKPGEQPKPPAKPAPAKPGEEPVPPKPGEQPKPPAEEPKPQPEPQETEAQKKEREEAAQKAEQKRFDDLKEYYKLPDEYVERLRTEPELVLPEMAARVHQAVFRGLSDWVVNTIPQLFQQHQQVQEANTRTKEAFFGRWPSLKGHEKEVLQIGQMHRQMNPKMTAAERLEKVGQLACAALGITPDPKPGEEAPPPPKPGQKVPAAKPMKPANPQGSSSSASPPSDNVFEKMAEEFLDEDRGPS
jgi:Predicted membrane protein